MVPFEGKQLVASARDAEIYEAGKGQDDALDARFVCLASFARGRFGRRENPVAAFSDTPRLVTTVGRVRLLSPVFLTTVLLPWLVWFTRGRRRLFWLGNFLLWYYYPRPVEHRGPTVGPLPDAGGAAHVLDDQHRRHGGLAAELDPAGMGTASEGGSICVVARSVGNRDWSTAERPGGRPPARRGSSGRGRRTGVTRVPGGGGPTGTAGSTRTGPAREARRSKAGGAGVARGRTSARSTGPGPAA